MVIKTTKTNIKKGPPIFSVIQAVALALKNILGLTCDPVCGLAEVPCIKRNTF